MARAAERQGHRVSARESYLRSVTYYRNVAWSARASDPHYRATLEKSRVLFKQFAALSDPPIEVVAIPVRGDRPPGVFPSARCQRKRRPTIIIGDNAVKSSTTGSALLRWSAVTTRCWWICPASV